MDFTKQPQNIISLCTGMRGIERGLESAGLVLRTLCYVEIETFIQFNLVKQMEKGLLGEAPIWSDLKTFDWGAFQNKVHGIIGGYPCQPFSVAGLGKGTEDPRHLWPYIANGIRTARPVWCFFENVRNHLNIGYETVRGELQEMGYTVREGIYSAEEVGAPHRRERLFILAIRSELAYTGYFRQGGRKHKPTIEQKEHAKEFFRSAELDNAGSNGLKQNNAIPTRGNGFEFTSKSMAYSNGTGSEKHGQNGICKSENERIDEGCGTARIYTENQWPARPGQDQYSWEPPRVKPRMGFMLNGYSHREDLLRMAGNGVVPQQCKRAFIDLVNKF